MMAIAVAVFLYFGAVLMVTAEDFVTIVSMAKKDGIPLLDIPLVKLWIFIAVGWCVGVAALLSGVWFK